MTIIKEFNKRTRINGVYVLVKVVVKVGEDFDCDPIEDMDFENETEKLEYKAKFDRGTLFNGVVFVEASAFGISGFDSIGGVHMHSNNMFNEKPFTKDLNSTLESYELVDNAIKDLSQNILTKAKELKKFI